MLFLAQFPMHTNRSRAGEPYDFTDKRELVFIFSYKNKATS